MTIPAQAPAVGHFPDPAETAPVEAELVRATLEGSARAFEEIVRLHSRRIYHYLHHMTRQAQDAEDLVQQTFIKAYHGLKRFDTSRPLINWLFTIARRTALNHFRSARPWEEIPESLAVDQPTPAHTVEGQDRVENIWDEARRRLSPRDFDVLWLRFGENLSVAETARIAGLTGTHVKIIVFRARKHLMEIKARL